MDQGAQCAGVGAERIRGVKSAKAAAAQPAAAFKIQGKRIKKWCSATYAEELRVQRLRLLQTAFADRKPYNSLQRVAANTAGIGKNQGKKGVEG